MTTEVPSSKTCPFRESEWDPTQPETFGSAHAEYTLLREENPLPWSNEFGGFWAAMTYDDVMRVAKDSDTFITSVQNVVPHVPRSSRRPPLHFDPPEHDAYRDVIDPLMRKAAVRKHEATFWRSARELVKDLLSSPQPDFARDFAMPFVADCFAAFLGVDPSLALRIREIGVRYSFAIQEMDGDAIAVESAQLYDIAEEIYWGRLEAQANPATDLVAGLHLAVQDPGNHINERSAIATVRQMIVAGMGAPQAVLSSSVVHLAGDRTLQQRLRDHPEDLPAAIEEFLRLYSPYRVFARTATKDVIVSGRKVAAGEPVALIFPSANRDEKHFERPDEFILRRKSNKHLAFGRGPHRCPAATMGRTELRIAIQTLLDATEHFDLSGEVTMMNWLEYGPRTVPLRLIARAGD